MSQILTWLTIVLLKQQDVSNSMTLKKRRRRKILRENHPAVIKHSFVGGPVAMDPCIVQNKCRRGVGCQLQGLHLWRCRTDDTDELAHIHNANIPRRRL